MRGVVDLGQVLVVEVGVDLGGGDVGVAEQFLHAAQVARGLEHVAGEGVPQQVRMHALEQALALGELAQAQLHGDRKSTRLNSVTNAHLVCRLLLEKKNKSTEK